MGRLRSACLTVAEQELPPRPRVLVRPGAPWCEALAGVALTAGPLHVYRSGWRVRTGECPPPPTVRRGADLALHC